MSVTQTVTQIYEVDAEGKRGELVSEVDGAFSSDKLGKSTRDVAALADLIAEDAAAPTEAEIIEPEPTEPEPTPEA